MIILENRETVTTELRLLDHNDISTLELPEGAITRLGRGWITGGMAFAPDGMHLVVATTIGCYWYDLNTMSLRALLNTEHGMLSDITFSHDGQWIATGNWDGIVYVWDAHNLNCVAKIDIPKGTECMLGFARDLTFSPDGQFLSMSSLIAYGGGTYFTLYDWKKNSKEPTSSFKARAKGEKRGVYPIAISPDATLLAYTSAADIISVVKLGTKEHIAEFSIDHIDSTWERCHKIVFSPCGEFLAVCNYGNKFQVWNVRNNNLELSSAIDSENQCVRGIPAYTSDGTLQVAGIYNSEVVIYDAVQGEIVDTVEYKRVLDGNFSADGTRLALHNKQGEVQIWTLGDPSKVKSLPTHLSRGVAKVWTLKKENQTLLSDHDPNGYMLWNVTKRQVKRTFYLPSSNPRGVVSISDSRDLLAAVENRNVVNIWNLTTDTQMAKLTENMRGLRVRRIVFSPTEEYLATVNIRNDMKIWDIATETQIAELTQKPNSTITAIGFSRIGNYFVSVYEEHFEIWDTIRWEKMDSVALPGESSKRWRLYIHPNRMHFITNNRKDPCIVWDLKSGKQLGPLEITVCSDTLLYKGLPQDIQRFHEVPEQTESFYQRIWGIPRFSPCGTFIAAVVRRSGRHNEIRFWDATTLNPSMIIIPPTSCQSPQTIAFSRCGNYFAVGAQWQDGQKRIPIHIYDVKNYENIHTFWGHNSDVWSIDFSPDGNILASGSYDGTILLWDMASHISS